MLSDPFSQNWRQCKVPSQTFWFHKASLNCVQSQICSLWGAETPELVEFSSHDPTQGVSHKGFWQMIRIWNACIILSRGTFFQFITSVYRVSFKGSTQLCRWGRASSRFHTLPWIEATPIYDLYAGHFSNS